MGIALDLHLDFLIQDPDSIHAASRVLVPVHDTLVERSTNRLPVEPEEIGCPVQKLMNRRRVFRRYHVSSRLALGTVDERDRGLRRRPVQGLVRKRRAALSADNKHVGAEEAEVLT